MQPGLRRISMCGCIKWFLIVLTIISLTSCWLPEKFDAKVSVNKDGSYVFVYDGILTFALALAAASKGELSAKDEAELQRETEKMKKEPGFKRAEYLGKGRYKVLFEKVGRSGEPYHFLSKETKLFSVIPQGDGSLLISGIKLTQKDIQELNSIGAVVDGTLSVSLERGIKVVKHNAPSVPKLFGTFGSFQWQIKSPNDPTPEMIVRPNI